MTTLYLYLLRQTENRGWDTYDSCVVCAASVEEARLIRPDGDIWDGTYRGGWTMTPSKVKVTPIGIAVDQKAGSVICASFNAG
jgi:hypothetical protein